VRLFKRIVLLFILLAGVSRPADARNSAANATRPFSLPFASAPGPGSWLIAQQYGNTTSAYNYGKYWYGLGQGLHFGLDFSAPCATPIVAIADGVIYQVDNPQHGAAPHNLLIRHDDLGYISFYGHLYVKPDVKVGQVVKRGEVVALSGDPEGTCVSRPHLHMEIRSLDTLTAYDPARLIDADWAMLSSIGYDSDNYFTKDLYAPNRWQAIEDQPDVHFGAPSLNLYRAVWPPSYRYEPPAPTLPGYTAPPVVEGMPLTFRELTDPTCCSQPWWSPDGQQINYWDGPDGQIASVMQIGITPGSVAALVNNAPSRLLSPNGQYEVMWDQKKVAIVRLSDGVIFPLDTKSSWPQFSPGSTRLLWRVLPKDDVPGLNPPLTAIWIANVDGSEPRVVRYQEGGGAIWLDDDRVLFMTREGRTTISAISILTLSTGEITPLLTEQNMLGLTVAPGGKYIMYYLQFQQDPAQNGIHVMATRINSPKPLLPFFGSWRWRDSHSVIYIPYAPGSPMRFILYDVETGQSHPLTDPEKQPFTILNDDWSIAPDGKNLVFWGSDRHTLWLVTLPTLTSGATPAPGTQTPVQTAPPG
jgi:Tol biopolymer transport system component